jgi:hypothetical protein
MEAHENIFTLWPQTPLTVEIAQALMQGIREGRAAPGWMEQEWFTTLPLFPLD